MKTILVLLFACFAFACSSSTSKPNSIELITQAGKQDSLFQALMAVTQNSVPATMLSDSLAFLVLPVQASCPSCRKKTIDSIVKHQTDLADNHYIIISASGGRKTIRGYFREQKYELPELPGKFFLDSNSLAYKHQLYEDKPTIYYTHSQKAYKRVAAIPATVKDDLQEFFSGHRQSNDQ